MKGGSEADQGKTIRSVQMKLIHFSVPFFRPEALREVSPLLTSQRPEHGRRYDGKYRDKAR
jgi:hypothetical protein